MDGDVKVVMGSVKGLPGMAKALMKHFPITSKVLIKFKLRYLASGIIKSAQCLRASRPRGRF